MTTHLHHVNARAYFRANVSGSLDYERGCQLLRTAILTPLRNGEDLLLDIREVEATGLPLGDIYRLAKVLEQEASGAKGRLVILDDADEWFAKTQFFAYTAELKGFLVKAFTDVEAAMAWLHPAASVPAFA